MHVIVSFSRAANQIHGRLIEYPYVHMYNMSSTHAVYMALTIDYTFTISFQYQTEYM